MKVPITRRALIARINRKLAKDYKVLRKSTERMKSQHQFGEYFILDILHNYIGDPDVSDLAEYATEIGCFSPAFEELEDA